MLVSESSRVEAFPRRLCAPAFAWLDDAELAHLRARLLVGHHDNAIEGIAPSPDRAAPCEMFLRERAPLAVPELFSDRSSGSSRAMQLQRFADMFDTLADTWAEAADLEARSDLLAALGDQVKAGGLPQLAAVRRLGITPARLDDALHGNSCRFSPDDLVRLTAAAEAT